MLTISSGLRKKSARFLIYILIGFCFGIAQSEARTISQSQSEENILVIHSYHPELSWTEQTKEEIDQSFQEIDRDVNIYHEYLDSDYYPELEYGEEFLDYIATKYSNSGINLIMVSDDPGLQLLIQQRGRYFSNNLPVVFLGIEHITPKLLEIPWLTGVFENRNLKATAIEATRQTWADTLVIINDSSLSGKANLEKIQELKKLPQAPKTIEIINDLLPEDISDRLGQYPHYVPILLSGRLRRNRQADSLIDYEKDVQLLQSRISNPIYTENSLRLGKGVVGGKIFDSKYHVRQAVDLAVQILNGTAPDQIGPLMESKNRWVFDYRELNRFDIKLSLLPEDSQLLYKELSFYEKYQELVWIVSLSFLFALLIIALLIETIRRRTIKEKILRENEQRYKDLAEAGANIFWELDSNLRLCYVSGNTKDICGFESEDLIGKSFPDLYQNSKYDFDWHSLQKIIHQQKSFVNFTYRLKEDNSSVRIFKLNGNPVFDCRNRFIGYRGIKQEITTEHNLSKKITYQATYDSLTGLLNRSQFDRKLQEAVKQTQESGIQSVFCYLDLDRFKIVNDTAGHLAGDRLLAELAQTFKSMVSQADVWGRLGGDEFGLLLEDCSVSQAQEICEQLVTAIKNYRFKWQTLEFDVGVSIGIVPILPTSINATELLSRADLACYQAKDLGRGRVYVAESHDRELNLQQAQMFHIANVSQAIAENRFYLVKQLIKPILHNGNGYMHYEILLRLQDRQGKIVPPGRFIPVAERYGVITIVDRWVIETTLKSYQQYFAHQQAIVSINLSGVSINDERFTDLAIDLIKNSPVQGDRLCFEITETAAISNINRAQKFIDTMKELGVKFALDDFGSGVSSFAYLKSLPVDYLKIDGSLVKNVSREECDRAIVSSINQVAHLMGMKTIAEFVEDRAILQHLDNIGVDYAQGYRIGKPVPVISDSEVESINNSA